MMKETITMSQKEADRLGIIQQVHKRQMRQVTAASQLGLSIRQTKRLARRYRDQGAAGLVSKHRGKRPGNAIAPQARQTILAIVRQRYADFGPTLASEMLLEREGCRVSRETLRQWMSAEGLWKPRQRRPARIHPRRPRRPCRGELVQIDGSYHRWFEQRGPSCSLIVFVDDATSELLLLRFAPAETTWAYMQALRLYLAAHGRPVALYSDKHSIFRVNLPNRDGELTQFSRALKTLDIAPIHANTPQAKGRVERAHGVLQDRLIKEMRLAGLHDIEAANAWLPAFISRYNQRFARPPPDPADAHRPVRHNAEELALILSLHHVRKLSKNLTFHFRHRHYHIQQRGQGYGLRGAAVTVCEAWESPVSVLYKGRQLPYQVLTEGEPLPPLDDEKSIQGSVDRAKAEQQRRSRYKPAPDHPWRNMPLSPPSATSVTGKAGDKKGTF